MKRNEWGPGEGAIRIKSLKTRSPYTIGEIATFPPDKAKWFIDNGVAKEVGRKKREKREKEASESNKD